MNTTVHMCVSVRGVLSRSDRELMRTWKGRVKDDNGRVLPTAFEIRNAFMDQLVQGREVIPCCPASECPDFDYKTGCPGHETINEGDDEEPLTIGHVVGCLCPDCLCERDRMVDADRRREERINDEVEDRR